MKYTEMLIYLLQYLLLCTIDLYSLLLLLLLLHVLESGLFVCLSVLYA